MRATLLTLLVVTAWASASGGCTSANTPNFCCVNDCQAHGAPGPVSCADPSKVCDADHFTCVDPTQGGMCTTSNDCSTVTPYCDPTSHQCKQCVGSMGCVASAPVCSAAGPCEATCTDDSACTGFTDTPHCETSGTLAGQCVACRTEGSDCSGNTPVCDMNVCRACGTGSECGSGVCILATGACVDENDALYLAPGGTGTNCTKAAPCGTFAAALPLVSSTRKTISMKAGSYNERVSISNLSVTIIGEGADLSSTTTGQLIDVSGASTVSIEALHIHDGAGSGGDGLRCEDNGGAPNVSTFRVRLDHNSGRGVNATNCTVDIERTILHHNTGGGILVNGGSFTIQNDFISQNGGISTVGGVSIQSINGGGAHVFAFNSVAGNQASNPANPGVDCVLIGVPFTFSNNVVYGNSGGSGKQVGGTMCSWTYSDLGDGTTGTGDINLDPMFANASADDLHLMTSSPAKDVADPSATLSVDIDGEPRPSPAGGRSDMGADEIQQ